MINNKVHFLAINGEIHYIDLLLDFAIQRGIMNESFGEVGFLQPGIVAFTTQEVIPFDPKLELNTKIEISLPLFIYIINYAVVFNNPQIKFTMSGNSNDIYFYQIKSQRVDIVQERLLKYSSEHRLKSMINNLNNLNNNN